MPNTAEKHDQSHLDFIVFHLQTLCNVCDTVGMAEDTNTERPRPHDETNQ